LPRPHTTQIPYRAVRHELVIHLRQIIEHRQAVGFDVYRSLEVAVVDVLAIARTGYQLQAVEGKGVTARSAPVVQRFHAVRGIAGGAAIVVRQRVVEDVVAAGARHQGIGGAAATEFIDRGDAIDCIAADKRVLVCGAGKRVVRAVERAA
jgi:hypothetical protein